MSQSDIPASPSRFTRHDGEVALLRNEVSGAVVLPGDPGYDRERDSFQTYGPRLPDVIVGAATVDDVRAAVRFAGRHGMPVAVQATGHALPNARVGGILISTRRMNGAHVDPGRSSAWVDAGARWHTVVEEASAHGLAPLSGSAPNVGAVPYILGGGIGLLSRRHGFAADHVRAVDVVTADAELVHVTPESDPDLFWALRGGDGNFGVVTGMEIELFAVPHFYGGSLTFDASCAADALVAWQEWTRSVPDEMTSSAGLVRMPDLPGVPDVVRGRFVCQIRIAHLGTAESAEDVLAPLRRVGTPVLDSLGAMPFAGSGAIHQDPTTPVPHLMEQVMCDGLDRAAVLGLLDLVVREHRVPFVDLRHLGGAMSRDRPGNGAVGNRDAEYLLTLNAPLSSATPGDDELESVRTAQQRLVAAMKPWSRRGLSLNFLGGRAATPEHVRLAYGDEIHSRLASIKAVHDPTNMFRHNRNVPPGAVGR